MAVHGERPDIIVGLHFERALTQSAIFVTGVRSDSTYIKVDLAIVYLIQNSLPYSIHSTKVVVLYDCYSNVNRRTNGDVLCRSVMDP